MLVEKNNGYMLGNEPTFNFTHENTEYIIWCKKYIYRNGAVSYSNHLRYKTDKNGTHNIMVGWTDTPETPIEIKDSHFKTLKLMNIKWHPLGTGELDIEIQEKNNPEMDITIKKEKNLQKAMVLLFGKVLYDTKINITAYKAFYGGQFFISEDKNYARFGSDIPNFSGLTADWIAEI